MSSTPSIRPAAVAGLFYAANPAELRDSVRDLLATNPASGAPPHAVIAPHAGYIYSGPVAARAYNRVAQRADSIRRVILLGPAHRVAFRGMALPTVTHFTTPLGDIPLDLELITRILDLPGMLFSDEAHAEEHSLEVHLPFLQCVLDEFSLLPLVVGMCDSKQVAALLETVWNDEENLVIISSDLSHYHDYVAAQQIDAETAQRIEALEEPLIGEQACGAYPLNGLLRLARKHKLRPERLDLRNSGDTAGPRNRVVGYGAWAVCDA